MTSTGNYVVHSQMLVRKPAAEVFAAFADAERITKFWVTHASGPLQPGARVVWEWRMYGASTAVRVIELEEDRRFLLEWGDPPRPLEFAFDSREDGTTLVRITDRGFVGSDDEIVAQAIDSKGGFSMVLAGLKAWLEHEVVLNLVADHHPDAQAAGRD